MAVPSVSAGRVLGHYRIIEQIGAGGMGLVFRARDEQLDRDVALKILPPLTLLTEPARRQFRREALSAARISHPNVAAAFDFGQQDGIDYLVTEYVPGVTLDSKLAEGPLSETEVLVLGIQLANGLDAAHRKGVIHRDLKPSNLRITPEGQLKILDFGLALLLDRDQEKGVASTLTAAFQYAGTPAYMAPEQLQGAAVDARTDVWAAGAVFYEMTTGRRAFGDTSGTQLISAILHQQPIAPRSCNGKISRGLECTVLKALNKAPGRRHQSAKEMASELAELATREKQGGIPFDLLRFGMRPWLRRRMVWISALILFLAVSLLLTMRMVRVGRPIARDRVIAVLPFESVDNDSATNALGLGLTETVTAKLVQASAAGHVQLVSARELMAQGVRNAEQARREFGTDLVLEGSLQQSGTLIRITCSVVDSKTHRQIAARTLTGRADEIFALQDRFVNELLDMLSVVIRPEQRHLLDARQDTQATAYDFYLRGRGYLQEYEKPENIDSAIFQFERALEVDKKYAPAYAGLGAAYATGFQQRNRGKGWLDKAESNCQQALAIAPDLAEGHSCLGHVYFGKGRYEDAVKAFKHSLELNKDSDETLGGLADAYQKLGNIAAAEQAYRTAIELRPNYWGGYSGLGVFFYSQARYSDAAEMFRKVTELAPENYRGYSNLGGMELFLGHYADAIVALKTSIGLRPDFESYGNLGTSYFLLHEFENAAGTFEAAVKLDDKDWGNWGSLGDALYQIPARRAEAMRAYGKAVELANAKIDVNPRDATALSCAADYNAILGNKTVALRDLQRALAAAPADSDVRFRAAILYNHFGDREKTVKSLKEAVELGFSRNLVRDTPDFDHLKSDAAVRALLQLN
jgi:eukaryotic-like serine/threonine-protein kinase